MERSDQCKGVMSEEDGRQGRPHDCGERREDEDGRDQGQYQSQQGENERKGYPWHWRNKTGVSGESGCANGERHPEMVAVMVQNAWYAFYVCMYACIYTNELNHKKLTTSSLSPWAIMACFEHEDVVNGLKKATRNCRCSDVQIESTLTGFLFCFPQKCLTCEILILFPVLCDKLYPKRVMLKHGIGYR